MQGAEVTTLKSEVAALRGQVHALQEEVHRLKSVLHGPAVTSLSLLIMVHTIECFNSLSIISITYLF